MSKRRKDNKKKQQQNAKPETVPTNDGIENEDGSENGVAELTKNVEKIKISPRAVTGSLTSQFRSKDIKIEQFSLSLHGAVLVNDTKLEFNWGRRYGFIGPNGSGKSTMLKCLGEREVPIPSWMSVFLLEKEVPPSDILLYNV